MVCEEKKNISSLGWKESYHINHKNALSAEIDRPEQTVLTKINMPYIAASDPGQHCLPFIQHFLDKSIGTKLGIQILQQIW